MNCPKCGKENPNGSKVCQFCNWNLEQVTSIVDSINIRTSWLAIASLLFGILSLVCLPFTSSWLWVLGALSFPVGMIAMILGITSTIRIDRSGGRLTGTGFAIIGMVTSVFAFLGVVPIAMQRMGRISYQAVCRSNLSGIGKAMLIYTNDYDEKLPRAGGPDSRWTGRIPNWLADNRCNAYGLSDGNGEVSISSSFYLLVKYTETVPKTFVCKNDSGTREFKPLYYGVEKIEITKFWDFGPEPEKYCSYTYHNPYGRYALNMQCDPNIPVAADRNPWMNTPYIKARDFSLFRWNGDIQQQKAGNSIVHRGEGQNVLFLDGHVFFEKRPYCGINGDNIYTFWSGPNIQQGSPPKIGSQPADSLDSLLVHDGDGNAKSRP